MDCSLLNRQLAAAGPTCLARLRRAMTIACTGIHERERNSFEAARRFMNMSSQDNMCSGPFSLHEVGQSYAVFSGVS